MSLLTRSPEIVDAVPISWWFPLRFIVLCTMNSIKMDEWMKNQWILFEWIFCRSKRSCAFKWAKFQIVFSKEKKSAWKIALKLFTLWPYSMNKNLLKLLCKHKKHINCCYWIATRDRIAVCTRISQHFVTWESYRFCENADKKKYAVLNGGACATSIDVRERNKASVRSWCW